MYSNIALSIAGSDSGGGAGIQADLRTFMALKVHGCSAITCITAQNSLGVNAIQAIQAEIVSSQIDAVISDFDIKAMKTGMLLNKKVNILSSKHVRLHFLPYKVYRFHG